MKEVWGVCESRLCRIIRHKASWVVFTAREASAISILFSAHTNCESSSFNGSFSLVSHFLIRCFCFSVAVQRYIEHIARIPYPISSWCKSGILLFFLSFSLFHFWQPANDAEMENGSDVSMETFLLPARKFLDGFANHEIKLNFFFLFCVLGLFVFFSVLFCLAFTFYKIEIGEQLILTFIQLPYYHHAVIFPHVSFPPRSATHVFVCQTTRHSAASSNHHSHHVFDVRFRKYLLVLH